jgi:hypothetical protein
VDQVKIVQAQMGGLVAAGFAATDLLHLTSSSFVPTPGSVLADFTAAETAFTGYSAFVLAGAWTSGLDAGGHWQAVYGGLAAFIAGIIGAGDTVGNWFITDTGSATLKAVGAFDTPFSFTKLADTLFVKPIVLADFTSGQDAEFIFGP